MKDGAHSHSHGTGGGGAAVVVIALVLLGSGVVSAVVHALEVILVVLGCTVALVAAACIAWIVWQLRQDRREASPAARFGSSAADFSLGPVGPEVRPQLEASSHPAIGPGREYHLHFHVSAAELAAIMRHYDGAD